MVQTEPGPRCGDLGYLEVGTNPRPNTELPNAAIKRSPCGERARYDFTYSKSAGLPSTPFAGAAIQLAKRPGSTHGTISDLT